MRITERLRTVTRLFLDTAPVVYYVEANTRYLAQVDPIFDALDAGTLGAVTSPVTLAECLVIPYRQDQRALQRAFSEFIMTGPGVVFTALDGATARRAAELRARYNLSLTDAFQVAAALENHCDAFVTNDVAIKRVTEIDVIVLDDFS